MGVPWLQLGGSIRQLALLVSALGWVCPAWQMSLSFLQEQEGRAAGHWERWEALSCRSNHIPRGTVGSWEAPSENPSHPRPLPAT